MHYKHFDWARTVCVSLFCSGMKPLNFSEEACRSGGTGHISAATTGASRDRRRWITSMTSWGATTTLVLRWPGTRLCSFSGSSSRLMWWKISKGGMEQKSLKTTVICTGALFCLDDVSVSPLWLQSCSQDDLWRLSSQVSLAVAP